MSMSIVRRQQNLSYLMETNPVCPGCDLKRSPREFDAGQGRKFIYCGNCRARGKSRKLAK